MKLTKDPREEVRRYFAERVADGGPDDAEVEQRFAEAFAWESQELIESPDYILAEDDAKAKLFKALVERLRKEPRE